MTTPNSCKSFFKPYLIYKLRTQTVTLVISALFNLLTLPLLATDILTYHGSRRYLINIAAPDIVYYFGAFILFILAITGGVRAFRSCVKKDAVDTLAALPLTRREQFIADMLSGYIANVGPFFPCALIAVIISFPADKALRDHFLASGSEVIDGLVIAWFFAMVLALFLLYTLSYITSVFAAVCCGKVSSSIIFTAVISTLMMIAGAGVGSYVKQCITGYYSYNNPYLNYIPPFGLLGFAYGNYSFMGNIDLTRTKGYPAPSVWGIILLIIAGAVVTYASYRIYKNRQAERTGKIIASNAIYKTICALSVIAVTSVSVSALYIFRLTWLAVLISLAIIAVLVLVLEALRGLKKAGFIITGTRCLITMGVCVIALIIVDKTGVFGARYINKSSADIQKIVIQSNNGNSYHNISTPYYYYTINSESITLEIYDQNEIEKFLELHNQTLKQHSKELREGDDFRISVHLKNGETIYRSYSTNHRLWYGSDMYEAIDELDNNFRSLTSYNSKASEFLFNKLRENNNMKVEIKDTFGDVEIPSEHLHDLYNLFTREYKEKYTPSDTVAGIFLYESEEYKHLSAIDIPSSCTETLEYVESFRGDNSERMALNIEISSSGVSIKCPITVKETETELGRELISLLDDDYSQYQLFPRKTIYVYSSNLNRYYISKENFDRAFEIIMQLIENKYSTEA